MKGSIFKRGNLWTVQIELDRDPVSGGRQREWHSGYQTKREAEAARVEILSRLQRGEHVAPSRLTFGEYMTDRWLPTRESQLAPSTFESYAGNVRHHIVPEIGSASLQGLSADVLTRFYGDRLASGLQRAQPLRRARAGPVEHVDELEWPAEPGERATILPIARVDVGHVLGDRDDHGDEFDSHDHALPEAGPGRASGARTDIRMKGRNRKAIVP